MEATNPYQTPNADVSAIPSQGGYDESNPFSPSGRFGRLSYLAWGMLLTAPIYIISIAMGVTGALTGAKEASPALFGVIGLLEILMIVPMILFAIRRLHDFDASGWWSILFIVPVANFILGLMLLLRPGTAGANRFAPPRITRGWEKVLGFIAIGFMVLAIIGIVAAIVIPLYASH